MVSNKIIGIVANTKITSTNDIFEITIELFIFQRTTQISLNGISLLEISNKATLQQSLSKGSYSEFQQFRNCSRTQHSSGVLFYYSDNK